MSGQSLVFFVKNAKLLINANNIINFISKIVKPKNYSTILNFAF